MTDLILQLIAQFRAVPDPVFQAAATNLENAERERQEEAARIKAEREAADALTSQSALSVTAVESQRDALQAKLNAIIAAYDRYKRRGVVPVHLVDAINAARAQS